VQLQGRVVHGDVKGENPIEAFGGPGGDVGLALDTEDGAVGTAVIEGGTPMPLGAADVEDPAGLGWDSPQ